MDESQLLLIVFIPSTREDHISQNSILDIYKNRIPSFSWNRCNAMTDVTPGFLSVIYIQ